jgi:16S rRNA A1518/A1519 N6-dimethyltransferase RsmA/KsgA/DIM1 with predicted DNA glycosylase/AP lyase activity
VVRLGVDPGRADDLHTEAAIDPRARAEQLSLAEFARITEAVP